MALAFHKPIGWTSFDVVNKVRRLIGIRKLKVGHAGTLDPLAEGLLVICTGRMTKQIDQIQAQEKEYVATVRFGATTPTYDRELPEENPRDASGLSRAQAEAALAAFQGAIMQVPPAYSAVRVDGKRAYAEARAGRELALRPRPVHIYSLDIEAFDPAATRLRVRCGKGTYIRSLAHDWGQALGTGAYLLALTRTRIGTYDLQGSLSIQAFETLLAHTPPGPPRHQAQ